MKCRFDPDMNIADSTITQRPLVVWAVRGPGGLWPSSVAFTRKRSMRSFLECCRHPFGGTWPAARRAGFRCEQVLLLSLPRPGQPTAQSRTWLFPKFKIVT